MIPGVDPEIKLRIDVAVAAYAYEFKNVSLVSDAKFDAMCRAVRPELSTGNELLDTFFRDKFQPHTGQWVHEHPDIAGLRRIFEMKIHFATGDKYGIGKEIEGRRFMVFTPQRPAPSDRAAFDILHSTDLFGPIIVESGAVKHSCSRCGRDVTINPVYGGCYC